MSGTLHIFRRDVVNGSPFFQVNYNVPGSSFAKVLDSSAQLDEFLTVVAALEPEIIDDVFQELDRTGSANLTEVFINEQEAVAHGMKHTPSDF